MSKEDIEDMIEEAFKKSDNPSKKTKKSTQAATGMSIEAIRQRLSRKRQSKKQLEAPRKKIQYFPTAVRRKLLEKYVPGGGLPPEKTMKVLLKETGLTRTQICNFYSHKKRALKKEAARQNAEANAIVNEIKKKMEDDKIQDFLDKLHKEHPSSFTKEGTGILFQKIHLQKARTHLMIKWRGSRFTLGSINGSKTIEQDREI
ncbi:unnamed protein product [Caenorhabditis brenneri]